LLPELFEQVFVPDVVYSELSHPEAPEAVRIWVSSAPAWFTISPAAAAEDADLRALDPGERAAISLSVSLRPDLLLMDDRAGVAVARAIGFAVTGTIGLLDRAARQGLIDLVAAFAALRSTNFHLRPELLDQVLDKHREWRRGS